MTPFIRSLFAISASFVLFFSAISASIAVEPTQPTFSDIKENWAVKEIEFLAKNNIIKGYEDNRFGPRDYLKRAHVAIMIARQKGYSTDTVEEIVVDMPKDEKDPMDYNLVQAAAKRKILDDLIVDGKFDPYKPITRAEMASILAKAYHLPNAMIEPKVFEDVPADYWAYNYIQQLYSTGVTTGVTDTTFEPEAPLKRDQFAAFLSRVLDASFKEFTIYHVGHIDAGKINIANQYVSFDEALKHVLTDGTQVILENNRVVWAESGLAVAAGTMNDVVNVYTDEELKKVYTYVVAGTEMKYMNTIGNAIQVELANKVFYVDKTKVKVVPTGIPFQQSVYKIVNDGSNLYLEHFEKGILGYTFGPAPQGLTVGTKLNSFDGIHFSDGTEYYQYFQYVPLHTATVYTADDLDRYVAEIDPTSPLLGLGEALKAAEAEYGVNAMYLLAHAIHESKWGKSSLASNKKNLFGLRAHDDDPLNKADTYETFEDSIMGAAMYISSKYFVPNTLADREANTSGIYHGAYLGNKAGGMNVKYASDPFWGQKIAGRMYEIDERLGLKEYNRFKVGLVYNSEILFVRPQPTTKLASIYNYPMAGRAILILEEGLGEDGKWLKILSEHPDIKEAYVHSDYVKFIN
ncbi:hypothetical protein EJF36_17735 [Bacillus sp. HMF5848]|uniref:S-layer homology domain-containing protein n=1 Tax=Bacillus sp. HMF5848 TaxID=2495421 RepID=UPI000F76A9EB|nr:S-layer homology domain-containing protein [Bacillus sp. HMF5848]RSK28558.1 hypothetical protein EJF36_17735 [Bacillus sp. HMF5848]